MTEGKAKAWTEGEKLGIFLQIMESAPIPWDSLKLPEGRTKKAVQVMIDREKTKMKKTRAAELGGDAADGDDAGEPVTKAKGKARQKRKADVDADAAPKKAKTPRASKKKASEIPEEKVVDDDEAEAVKAEPEDEEE